MSNDDLNELAERAQSIRLDCLRTAARLVEEDDPSFPKNEAAIFASRSAAVALAAMAETLAELAEREAMA